MYFFLILYLSVYSHGRSFFILYIGKCIGSLSMYRGGFGYSTIVGVVREYDVFGGLGVCYDLVFYIHLLGCLVSYVLDIVVCIE